MQRRKSGQREKIYRLIAQSQAHPTAQWLYDVLKREMPSLSLGNLYRNLAILVEDGRINRRDFGDGQEHYDAITMAHYHFVCEQCGAVSDFAMPVQDNLTAEARKITPHSITGHTIQFFGICHSCRLTESTSTNTQGEQL
jgi:Fur family peroxide stress response transcriptional regulator